MKAEKYLDESKEVEMYVFDTEDRRFKAEITGMDRPIKDKLRDICEGKRNGSVKFTDVGTFNHNTWQNHPEVEDGEELRIFRAELYYGGKKIGMRDFPEVCVTQADTLEITYKLEISRNTERGIINI